MFDLDPATRPHYLSILAENQIIKRRFSDLKEAVPGKGIICLDKGARQIGEALEATTKLEFPVTYIDIGPVKYNPLIEAAGVQHHQWADALNTLQTIDDLIRVYGSDNVRLLQELVSTNSRKDTLVVDDCMATSRTRGLSLRILKLINQDVDYTFFPLIESWEDKKVFTSEGEFYPHLPWHRYFTLRADNPNPKSFTSLPQQDQYLERALDIQKELRQLVTQDS